MEKNIYLLNVAEVTLSYSHPVPVSERPVISCSKDAEQIFRSVWSDKMELLEECYLMYLNTGNQVTGILHLSKGGITGTVVDVKLVLSSALKAMATGIILAHNHPSGNLKPSQTDIDLTKRIREASRTIDVAFLDHLILCKEGYYSFADAGEI